MKNFSLRTSGSAIALAVLFACSGAAVAGLPKPVLTPEQQQAAAAKQAVADAKLARDKEALTAAMDRISNRWQAQAKDKGWRINPPITITAHVPVAAGAAVGAPAASAPAPAAGLAVNLPGTARSGVTPPAAGMPAAAPSTAAPGTAAAAPATGAAPLSRQALNAANVPIKSEKLGTAAPSHDVKTQQTGSVPKGVGPAVEYKATPSTANKE
ncbi:hypothetical protein [Massilia sp. H6]|uniref:hypothetical protein n=1 Tax=Massilia sp. H6 TaxID=2970464 RepID=UPI002168DE07|nr:hypothetical protein [Massilia sp. H6]UVW27393.1 hypothetical protein NRS07_12570 [Massilia sp. H6]